MISVQFLSSDEIQSIHSASLQVLEKTGISVKNNYALDMLEKEGCFVENTQVRIPSSVLEDCIHRVPSAFHLFGGDGNGLFEIGKDRVVFNPGSSAVFFQDRDTYEIRKGTSKDVIELVQLVEHLEHIEAQSTALIPSDVPEPISDLYRLYLALKHSVKPIVTGAFSKQGLVDMIQLLEAASGGSEELVQKPRAIFDCCPTSPLTWGDTATQNLIDCASSGIPAAIVPAPLMGATSPITIQGTLVQINAEILSGVVISQLTTPGTPIIYGGAPGSFDMKYATPRFSAVEAMITSCASAELAKHYGFPSQAYLGTSDSKSIDSQSGFESGLGIALGALSRINVISGPGMISHLNCQSLEKLVIDNEFCGTANRLLKGVSVEGIDVVTDLISKVGSTGDYLRQKHTSKKLRTEHFMPSQMIDRLSLESWIENGSKDIKQKAREAVSLHLQNHAPMKLEKDKLSDLKTKLKKIVSKYHISVDDLPLY